MTFGEYIKNLRMEKGWSQRELASKVGITNAAISRLESSERKKPSLLNYDKLPPSQTTSLLTFYGQIVDRCMKIQVCTDVKPYKYYLLTQK
jgi:transcriptional regulator with XRE-family HTH domain